MLTDIVVALHATRQYPSESHFRNCIDSLYLHTSNFRLIVVDDCCDAEGRKVIDDVCQSLPNNTLMVRTFKQRWFTRAYNLGMRFCRYDRSVLINSDVIFSPGWLEELQDVWYDTEKSLGGRVGLVGSVYSEEEPRRYAVTRNPGYVTGHCWLVSIGALFDCSNHRGMPGWYLNEKDQAQIHIRSDVHICWELNNLGYHTVQSFKSAVGHIGGASWGYDLMRVSRLRLEEVDD